MYNTDQTIRPQLIIELYVQIICMDNDYRLGLASIKAWVLYARDEAVPRTTPLPWARNMPDTWQDWSCQAKLVPCLVVYIHIHILAHDSDCASLRSEQAH